VASHIPQNIMLCASDADGAAVQGSIRQDQASFCAINITAHNSTTSPPTLDITYSTVAQEE